MIGRERMYGKGKLGSAKIHCLGEERLEVFEGRGKWENYIGEVLDLALSSEEKKFYVQEEKGRGRKEGRQNPFPEKKLNFPLCQQASTSWKKGEGA